MKKHVLQLVAICVCLAMVGCTTMHPLALDSASLSKSLKRGDHVEVVTTKGQELQFAVDSVDAQGVQGGGQRVAYNDIQSISRKEVSAGRTALVAVGIIAVGA